MPEGPLANLFEPFYRGDAAPYKPNHKRPIRGSLRRGGVTPPYNHTKSARPPDFKSPAVGLVYFCLLFKFLGHILQQLADG